MSTSSSSSPSPRERSDSLSTNGKRIRTSKPKVRSGCVTCKIRRIKCDEIKPACNRCTKFGRECGGYKVQLTYEERVAARNGRSRILPKVYQASPTTPHTHQILRSPPQLHPRPLPSPLPSPTLTPTPTINLPLTPQQIFCIETSLELCRTLESPAWTSIKVELCKPAPFINHAFSAIRMLSKGPSPTPDFIDPQLSSQDPNAYSFHSQRFLEGSRHLLSTGPHQPLLAPIIALLVTTLETLQFHHEPALSHIQLGLTLLPQLQLEHSQTLQTDTPPFFIEEIVRVFQMLETKATFLDSYFAFYAPMSLGFASPFVMQQVFCGEEVECNIGAVGGYENFVFADGESTGFDHSRGSSIVVGTP